MKSLLSNERKCYVCGSTSDIHLHHVFYGTKNRRQSDKHGCTVYLCARHHNMSNAGVHADRALDLKIKQDCQQAFEHDHTREEFMKIFGRNYLD